MDPANLKKNRSAHDWKNSISRKNNIIATLFECSKCHAQFYYYHRQMSYLAELIRSKEIQSVCSIITNQEIK